VSDSPAVSVVIPTRQRRAALESALRSLCRQSLSPSAYEVVVAVDGSTDGTREMVASFPAPYALRLVDGPERGRAAACNVAIATAVGEVIVVLDDDMEPIAGCLERHCRHHPPGSRCCVLGAVPVALDGSSTLAARYVQAKFEAHLARLDSPDHVYTTRDFYSGNASLRAEVLREVGGFDESFAVYGNEDVELALRLRAAGVTLRYDAGALARQRYGKDLRGLARDTRAKGSTTVQVARVHPDVFATLRLAAPQDSSRPWLVARSMLLALSRRRPQTSDDVIAVAALLERLGLWRQPLFYRALLDYVFWTGVDAELRKSADTGDLERLDRELHRGPIELLSRRATSWRGS
jgi:GT2 family glycosyltransferase